MTNSPIRHPSGWLPIAMSMAALAMVISHAAMYGIVHEVDEGTPAHIFQILMVVQVPIVAWFAIRWLPRDAAAALRVLALQAAAGIAAFASVYFLTG